MTTKRVNLGLDSRTKRKLSDPFINSLLDFDFHDSTGFVWDTDVPGLRIRIGKLKNTWSFLKQGRKYQKRTTTHRILGTYPTINTKQARKLAQVVVGKVADGDIEPGKRAALRFGEAWEAYLKHLKEKAEKLGKPPRWYLNAKQIGDQLLLPEFNRWPLVELSNDPDVVAEWHQKVTKASGPVQANRAVQLMRACYRRALRRNRSLPLALPTSAVVMNDEDALHGSALAFKDFPKWKADLDKIESPIHRSYHLTNLLTGCRPGELARLRRDDIRPSEGVFVIPLGKSRKEKKDIRVVLTKPIMRALNIALKAGDTELVFPGCAQVAHRDPLSARGMDLRRTYRTVAADAGVDELLAHFLMSHTPNGISQRYVQRMILSSGEGMREAQDKISQRIVTLLKWK
jgi:integrase